jgi:hypothetical protein
MATLWGANGDEESQNKANEEKEEKREMNSDEEGHNRRAKEE